MEKVIKDCESCGWQKINSDLRRGPECGHPEQRRECILHTYDSSYYEYKYWATRKEVLEILAQQKIENKDW